MATRHRWEAPRIPALTPPTATVVIVSRCGIRLSMPAGQVTEWAATADLTPHEDDCTDCVEAPGPVDVRI